MKNLNNSNYIKFLLEDELYMGILCKVDHFASNASRRIADKNIIVFKNLSLKTLDHYLLL